MFLIVEMCDGADGRVTTENASAKKAFLARATGVDASRILCLESTLPSSAFNSDAASCWRASASAWYREWARERGDAVAGVADARDQFGSGARRRRPRDARGRRSRRRRRFRGNAFVAAPVSAASALRSAAEAANEPSTTTSEDTATSASERTGYENAASAASASAAAASALASAAASRSLGSFLRWAIEGRPQFGIAGAPAIAAARLKSDPGVTRRAALSAALYSYSAAEFAAGFVLSWAVPGPLAAHAAHFTNRFRVCFAVACMAGESPLDPRVAAVVLATCAGADGAATKRAAFAFRDEAFSFSNGSGASTKNDDDDDDDVNEPDDDKTTSRASSHSSSHSLIGSLTSAVRRVADGGDAIRRDAVEAMRRVYDAGGDAMRRAERDADLTATRVFRAALVAFERRRCKKHDDDDGDACFDSRVSNRRRVLIASPHSAALETARRAFANRLALAAASECAAVVCGPLWLAATQADVVSVLAGAMSVHVCNASLQVFLPPRGTPVFTDVSTLLSSSDASRGRGGKKKENDALAETSVLGPRARSAPAAGMASDAASAAATSLGDVAASAQRVAAEASSSVTRWASAAASVVWANGRRANARRRGERYAYRVRIVEPSKSP